LECVDHFLRPEDLDQDVAKTGSLLQALVVPAEGDEGRAQGAIGLRHPGRRRLESRLGTGHVRRHHVLGPEELDDGSRLLTALLLDPRQVPDPQGVELPQELYAYVVPAGPLVEAAVGTQAE